MAEVNQELPPKAAEFARGSIERIAENIEVVHRFVEDMDFKVFHSNPVTRSAVEMCIIRIGEAAARLPESVSLQWRDVPAQQMIDLGKELSQRYWDVDYEAVWAAVTVEYRDLLEQFNQALSDTSALEKD